MHKLRYHFSSIINRLDGIRVGEHNSITHIILLCSCLSAHANDGRTLKASDLTQKAHIISHIFLHMSVHVLWAVFHAPFLNCTTLHFLYTARIFCWPTLGENIIDAFSWPSKAYPCKRKAVLTATMHVYGKVNFPSP